MMLQQPRLKTFLTIYPASDRKWLLRGGGDELCRIELKDDRAVRTFGILLPLLHGGLALEDILSRAEQEGVEQAAALSLLSKLEEAKCLEESSQAGLEPAEADKFRDQIAFFSHFTTQGGASLQAKLRCSRVAVIGEGPLRHAMVRQLADAGLGYLVLLESADQEPLAAGLPKGVQVESIALDPASIWSQDHDPGELAAVVLAQQRYDPALLEAMDAFSKRRLVPWLLVRSLSAREGWIGPLFVPGETASYLSLEARFRGNMTYFAEYQALDAFVRKGAPAALVAGGLSATLEILAGIAVTELVKYLTRFEPPFLAGRFLTVNLSTWETEAHTVLRVPGLDRAIAEPPLPFPWKEVSYGESDTHQRRA